MTVNSGDPTPAYMQIANSLRSQIERGELRDGDQLPSQRELIGGSGAAPGTVQRAITLLESEGLVIKIQGRGTFVRRPKRLRRDGSTRHKASHRPASTGPMEAEAAQQNFQRGQTAIRATLSALPGAIAVRLGALEGDLALTRRMVLTLNAEPAATAVSYFAHDLTDDPVLQTPEEVEGGTHEYLRKVRKIPLNRGVEDLVARMPTPDEVREIRIAPGTPVVELIRTIYGKDGNPVEVTVFVFAADRYEFRYEVPMV